MSLPAHAARRATDPLPIRLCGHAAENDLLAVIVADLGKHHLERANLITSDRPHMAAIDGERDGLRRGRWCGGWLATACCSRRAPTLMVRRRLVSIISARARVRVGTLNYPRNETPPAHRAAAAASILTSAQTLMTITSA